MYTYYIDVSEGGLRHADHRLDLGRYRASVTLRSRPDNDGIGCETKRTARPSLVIAGR